jgi:hypothetical protein
LRRGTLSRAILHDGAGFVGSCTRQSLLALGLHRRSKGDMTWLEGWVVDAGATGLGQRLQHVPARIPGNALYLTRAGAQPEAP